MTITTASAGGGDIDVMFLQQVGGDPFKGIPERDAQAVAAANYVGNFISQARTSLDIAIYDFRLAGQLADIVTQALRERARNSVAIRIIYDATTEPNGNGAPADSLAHLEADKKAPGTEVFVNSFADIARIVPVRGYRVLMHCKYLVRDGNSDEAAMFLGSANYTNDSWGLQENNLLQLRSRELASHFTENFNRLFSTGHIPEKNGTDRNADTVNIGGVPVTVAFAPWQSPAIVKEIVGAITCASQRLLVASGVLSSGPILAALSEAIDRGLPPGGLYDGPQMDLVRRQWKAAHVGADKIKTWDKVASHLARKNSLAYNRHKPHQPHNFMHNKLVVADDVVVTGSFNLSNHAMGNAEDVLLIHDAGIASKYAAYIGELETKYRASARSRRR
jgi:phosphatidylserine/phosphatidylglycerophosphate/cardiolipin synthase-like enzyme